MLTRDGYQQYEGWFGLCLWQLKWIGQCLPEVHIVLPRMGLGGLRDPFGSKLKFWGYYNCKNKCTFTSTRYKLSLAEQKIIRNNKIEWNYRGRGLAIECFVSLISLRGIKQGWNLLTPFLIPELKWVKKILE